MQASSLIESNGPPRAQWRRSAGPLRPEQAVALRATGVRLVYDPVQIGWLPADMLDDLDGAEARGVALRRWVEADAPVLRKLLEDPQVWRLLPEGYPGSLSEADALALIDLANHAPHHDVRAIVEGGVPVGQIRLVLETGEIGYWLGRAHWGRGLARRALCDWIRLCRAGYPALRLFARIHQENAASRRVAEAAGFCWQGPDPADPRFGLFALNSGSVPA